MTTLAAELKLQRIKAARRDNVWVKTANPRLNSIGNVIDPGQGVGLARSLIPTSVKKGFLSLRT